MGEHMGYKFLNFIIVAFFIFLAYLASIAGSIELTLLIGFKEENFVQFIIIILISSVLSFLTTLIIQFAYQLLSKGNMKPFVRSFHGTHLIYLYISGLITTLGVLEPILIEESIVKVAFMGEQMSMVMLIFFIILSNYYIYNSVVINNDFYIEKEDDKNIRQIDLKFIYLCITVILSPVLIARILIYGGIDNITFILFMIITAPYYIKKLFLHNY